MNRLVIACPYYAADRESAFSLARFIRDLEPAARPDVELCFVARSDAAPIMAHEMMEFVPTFKVSWHVTEGKEVGHPAGANAMARDFFAESLRRVQSGQWADVEAVLFMEPDCVPVARDWIDQLVREWRFAKTVCDVLVVGCYRDKDVDVPHVNGNALWHPELARKVDLRSDNPSYGWDSWLAPQLIGRKVHTSLIANLWKETKVPEERMRANPFTPAGTPAPVLLHGVKDGSAWEFAMKALAI